MCCDGGNEEDCGDDDNDGSLVMVLPVPFVVTVEMEVVVEEVNMEVVKVEVVVMVEMVVAVEMGEVVVWMW